MLCVYPRIQLLSQTAFLSSSSDELEDEERLDWLESWYGRSNNLADTLLVIVVKQPIILLDRLYPIQIVN